MIEFSLPEKLEMQRQMTEMVARDVMRPQARYLDENEHTRPDQYVQFMWPVMADMQAASLKRERRKAEEAAAGDAAPKERRGPGTFFVGMMHLAELLAWGDVGQYLCTPSALLGGTAIEAVGTLEQKERFLSRFADPKAPPAWGAMAMTEPGAGSDTSAISTTARLDEETNEWVLNGEKIFCTNGGLALDESNGLVVVWATVNKSAGRAGMKSFVVEAGTPGVTVTKAEIKHGIRASDTVAISFENARIPYDNILGSAEVRERDSASKKGFKGAMKTFDASRPIVAATAVGVARAALELTKEKLAEAGIAIRYDAPPHELTAIERDIIDMEAELKATWLLTLRAGSMMDHGEPNALESSMCKAKAGDAGTRIAHRCVELLGPMGYSREWLIEKLARDAKIADLYEGTQEINLLIVARQVLNYSSSELPA
ncbi:MAG TPA: acyl-CoA dehydrogenase family protein [Aggregatilineales bacterium]|nr:acyl-CoA dehydrogenase family protein [Aggregatilineales bacterium]